MSCEDGSWTIWIQFSSFVKYIFEISDFRYTLSPCNIWMSLFSIHLVTRICGSMFFNHVSPLIFYVTVGLFKSIVTFNLHPLSGTKSYYSCDKFPDITFGPRSTNRVRRIRTFKRSPQQKWLWDNIIKYSLMRSKEQDARSKKSCEIQVGHFKVYLKSRISRIYILEAGK